MSLGLIAVGALSSSMFENMGPVWSFITFAIINVIFIVYIHFFFKETMGLTSDEKRMLFMPKDLQESMKNTAAKELTP